MMSRARVATVYGLLVVLIGGHLFDSATRREHWPFSNYPMFSGVEGQRLDTCQVTCLYTDDAGATREAYFNPDWVPSLPQYRFMVHLRQHMDSSPPDPVRVRQMLADYLYAYDACRRAGLNRGPDVRAVRVYRVTVPLEVPMRVFDLEHRFADYARLAVQVDRPPSHAAARPGDPSPRAS